MDQSSSSPLAAPLVQESLSSSMSPASPRTSDLVNVEHRLAEQCKALYRVGLYDSDSLPPRLEQDIRDASGFLALMVVQSREEGRMGVEIQQTLDQIRRSLCRTCMGHNACITFLKSHTRTEK